MLQQILKAANEAYVNGEFQIDESITDEQRGDGLATFIRNEIIDVCIGEDEYVNQLDWSIAALKLAQEQLGGVIIALDKLRDDLP